MHLTQHLSQHLHKQTPFSPHLGKIAYKGKLHFTFMMCLNHRWLGKLSEFKNLKNICKLHFVMHKDITSSN